MELFMDDTRCCATAGRPVLDIVPNVGKISIDHITIHVIMNYNKRS
jgi:hypothetical protein